MAVELIDGITFRDPTYDELPSTLAAKAQLREMYGALTSGKEITVSGHFDLQDYGASVTTENLSYMTNVLYVLNFNEVGGGGNDTNIRGARVQIGVEKEQGAMEGNLTSLQLSSAGLSPDTGPTGTSYFYKTPPLDIRAFFPAGIRVRFNPVIRDGIPTGRHTLTLIPPTSSQAGPRGVARR